MIIAPSQRVFVGVSTLLFAASTAATVAACIAMSAMHDMPMPGGWTMSMMWMRMPGQTWPGMAAAFLAMWLVMTVAMMLPSLLPTLWRYRSRLHALSAARRDRLTACVAAGYLAVWMLFGAVVFALGVPLTSLEMAWPALARAVPLATGAIVLIAGLLQFSAWKTHHLACCRGAHACCRSAADERADAWRQGLRLGMHCVHCCFGLTMLLLVVGMMDLRAMALVTAAISAERLAPGGERIARAVGTVLIAAGSFALLHAAIA